MSGWTKLFSSIVTSSIWVEDDAILRVWIAMLAMADAEGGVEGSVPGFANLAHVTTEQMRLAVDTLSSPDADSRTPDHEGRRIEAIEGGWRILNYRTYRERGQAKEGSRAPYYRTYRQRKANVAQQDAQQRTVARYTEERGERKSTEERVQKKRRKSRRLRLLPLPPFAPKTSKRSGTTSRTRPSPAVEISPQRDDSRQKRAYVTMGGSTACARCSRPSTCCRSAVARTTGVGARISIGR